MNLIKLFKKSTDKYNNLFKRNKKTAKHLGKEIPFENI